MNSETEKLKSKYKRREILDKVRADASNTLDKYLLSFSTASIYLSLFFRKELVENLVHKWLLITSWLLLAGCILITLISFKLSEKAHERQIEIVDEQINNNYTNQQNCWSVFLGYINLLSILLFVSGIMLLIIFFIYNIK
ncbi:MAG: hypothetical protein NT135_01650 [Candidatus Berkelbacteria bacterium]|nr:hypothetical protein [Candidatus Berkelbacteria bacterium]